MRYCICRTRIENKNVSYPEVLIYTSNGIKFEPYFIKNCKDLDLLVAGNLNDGEQILKHAKDFFKSSVKNGITYNYFLLKVDSLNFPFKLNNYFSGKIYFGKTALVKYKVLNCK